LSFAGRRAEPAAAERDHGGGALGAHAGRQATRPGRPAPAHRAAGTTALTLDHSSSCILHYPSPSLHFILLYPLYSFIIYHPLQFQGGLTKPVVKIIAESLSQHDEKHVVPTSLSGIRVGERRFFHNIPSWSSMAPQSVRFDVRSRKLSNIGQSLDG
jgi:hypothetical protein